MILTSDFTLVSSFALYSAACLIPLYLIYAFFGGKLKDAWAQALLLCLWVLHGLNVLSTLLGMDEFGPRFGFAPALSATAWLILTCYALERHWFPQSRVRLGVSSMGLLTLVLSLYFPGQALQLNASAWLPLHWALGMASYGLFGAAVVHALILSNAERLMRQAAESSAALPLLTLERLTYRFVIAGFVLLTSTLLAGFLFGETLFGTESAWRWDHKTVLSLMAWLTFAYLLTARYRYGFRGRRAIRVIYIGTGLLFLAYAGSHFVREVILHR